LSNPNFYQHRADVLQQLGADEAVLLFASSPVVRTGTSTYRYRPDSNFYWLTGWEAPEAVAFLRPGELPFIMFVRPRDAAREQWDGTRAGPQGAQELYGADISHPIEELLDELPKLLRGVRKLHYNFGSNVDRDAIVLDAIRKAAQNARKTFDDVPETFLSYDVLLHELRLFKSAEELALMREATRITADAHLAALSLTRPGVYEHEVEAALLDVFRKNGSTGAGYTPIVAGGSHATTLHYIENNDLLRDGDLLLIDAGAEHQYYTADVTRTFPVNGRFTSIQRAAYDHVLEAQRLAIEQAVVGSSMVKIHDTAIRRLVEGMVDLGLLEGPIDDRIEDLSFRRYYPHGTGHWLGLDVHDVGHYAHEGAPRLLERSMVLTVEPGLYIPEDDDNAPAELRGLGIRIEDDICVTDDSPEILSSSIPKDPDDLEALIQG
jgi:Xaa-Pro aminopeptidase